MLGIHSCISGKKIFSKMTEITSVSKESCTICWVTRSVVYELSPKCVVCDLPHWAFPYCLREHLNKRCTLLSAGPAECHSHSCWRHCKAGAPLPPPLPRVFVRIRQDALSQTEITQAPNAKALVVRSQVKEESPQPPATAFPPLESLPTWSPLMVQL